MTSNFHWKYQMKNMSHPIQLEGVTGRPHDTFLCKNEELKFLTPILGFKTSEIWWKVLFSACTEFYRPFLILFHRKFIFESIGLCWLFNTLQYKLANIHDTMATSFFAVIFRKLWSLCRWSDSLFTTKLSQLLEPTLTSPLHNHTVKANILPMGIWLCKILCWSRTVLPPYILPS